MFDWDPRQTQLTLCKVYLVLQMTSKGLFAFSGQIGYTIHLTFISNLPRNVFALDGGVCVRMKTRNCLSP